MNIDKLYEVYLNSKGVSTDTRSLTEGELFFALKGENFDGNTFIGKALDKGASCVVMSDKSQSHLDKTFYVEDSLEALQDLARMHRKMWGRTVIAITGSNGKTTTKELLAAVLSKKYRTFSTRGNLNNHIGVPLSLLSVKNEELAIIEMGANHPGEIETLCEIADPDFGIITNIGKAHLEGFGGLKGVEKAKGELYDHLVITAGTALVNTSESRLKEMARNRDLDLFTYGLSDEADLIFDLTEQEPQIKGSFNLGERHYDLRSSLMGAYNFMNIMTAVAGGVFMNVPAEQIVEAIAAYEPDNNRSQFVKGKSNLLLLDAYNANPTSMKSALKVFAEGAGKKMVILGDMMELGDYAHNEHEEILHLVNELQFDQVILVGPIFYEFRANSDFPFQFFAQLDDCLAYLENNCPGSFRIMLKGSRKISLERTTNLLLNC